jgi:hypothetical protein
MSRPARISFVWRGPRKRRQRKSVTRPRHRRAALEHLEPRWLLAGTISLVRYFDTWAAGIIKSTDAAGLGYHPPSGHLLIADSEINETSQFKGFNVFEVSPRGDQVFKEYATGNKEPTGITYNVADGFFYITNDDTVTIGRYDNRLNTVLASVKTTSAHSSLTDPEGITSDAAGNLYVVHGSGGANVRQVSVWNSNLKFQYRFGVGDRMSDAEGIAYNPQNNHLYLVSDPNQAIFEYTLTGQFVEKYDISKFSPKPVAPQGLEFAPTSDPNDSSSALALYIADGMVDNFPDGRIYEAIVGATTPTNSPPNFVGDPYSFSVDESAGVGTPVGTVLASDPNGDALTYSITAGNSAGHFAIAAATGVITVNGPLDADLTSSYALTVRADDGRGGTDTASLNISVNSSTPGGSSLEVRVGHSADDAEESSSGAVDLTSSDLELVFDGSNQAVGMRFNGIGIPRGATISNAWVQFEVDERTSETTSLVIQGEAADNAERFTNSQNNVSSRPRTSVSVSWNPVAWTVTNQAGPDQRTPNLAAVIQQIVDRPGWSSGNSLAILITGMGERVAKSYNKGAGVAPLLHIEFGTSGPTNGAPVAQNQSVSTPEATPLAVTLSASDPDGDPLTYNIVSGPTGGVLSGTAPNLVYTPNAGFTGQDSFTFRASDGMVDSNLATVSILVTSTSPSGSVDARVAAGSDDGEESSTGKVDLTSSDLELMDNSQIVGMRFVNLAIPPGATITAAYLQFQVDETATTSTSLEIRGQAADHAATFTTSTSDISSRPRTTAFATWAPPAWNTVGQAGLDQRTSDLSVILQEIVSRPGWASGNALVIVITGSGKRVAESFNGTSAGAPLLHVEFTVGGGSSLAMSTQPTAGDLQQAVLLSATATDPQQSTSSDAFTEAVVPPQAPDESFDDSVRGATDVPDLAGPDESEAVAALDALFAAEAAEADRLENGLPDETVSASIV